VAESGNLNGIGRIQVVKTHGPVRKISLGRNALEQSGESIVPRILRYFLVKGDHGFLVSFQDLQEVSTPEQQHPCDSQPGVVLSRLVEEFSQILCGERNGALAQVKQRENVARVRHADLPPCEELKPSNQNMAHFFDWSSSLVNQG
jgi:hypothetical protein